MTISADATAIAALESGARGAIYLVEMDFTTGTQRFTNWPLAVVVSGNTYGGLGNLTSVSGMSESEAGSAEQLTLGFTVVNQAMLSQAMGNASVYRDRAVRIYLQVINSSYVPAGAPILRWTGRMDKVQIKRKASEQGPSSGTIEMVCTRSGMARARGYAGRRLSNAQQQQRFVGDLGFEYMQGLIEQPARWLSKRFQEQT